MIVSKEIFLSSIKTGSVFYFIDHEINSPKPHYFVVLNRDISTSPVLVLPVSTTQIEKRKKYYSLHGLNKESLVIIQAKETNGILEKESAFDCNSIINKSIDEIYEIYIKQKLKYIGQIPSEVIIKLKNGVLVSNQVEKWLKDLI